MLAVAFQACFCILLSTSKPRRNARQSLQNKKPIFLTYTLASTALPLRLNHMTRGNCVQFGLADWALRYKAALQMRHACGWCHFVPLCTL